MQIMAFQFKFDDTAFIGDLGLVADLLNKAI